MYRHRNLPFKCVKIIIRVYEIVSKHETLPQCCFDIGPTSATLAQHWNSTGSVFVSSKHNIASKTKDYQMSQLMTQFPPLQFIHSWFMIFWEFGGYNNVQISIPTIKSHIFRVIKPVKKKKRQWTNVHLTETHRLRRWSNVNPALVQCIVFIERY